MTRDELTTVNALSKKIRREQERLANLNDWILRITHELSGLPTEQSYQKSKIEDLTIQKVDCENTINELKIERAGKASALIKRLDDGLEDNNQKAVIVERYGFGQCFKKIAEKLHMTERSVFYHHRKGLQRLFNLI